MQRWISIAHQAATVSRTLPVALRYLVTFALLALVVRFHHFWPEEVAHGFPFLAFFPIIFIVGAFLDRGNGFFATILSALAVSYFYLEPRYSMEIFNRSDQVALGLFVLIGFIISWVVEDAHRGIVSLAAHDASVSEAMRDREVLLNELAHRTRNDLASVVTLLNMQSRSASPDAKEALASAAERVQTIARVHRRLELRDEHVFVDTKSYIEELCADLRLSRLAMRPVTLECQAESHSISLEKAVPLGLIINESVTNAAKHAFPDQRQGRILVDFRQAGGIYRLVVTDDGVGRKALGEGAGAAQPSTDCMGKRLMEMLAAQLGSKLEIADRSPGSAIIVTCLANRETRCTAAKSGAD